MPPLGFLVKKYKKAFLFTFLSICFDWCVIWTPLFHWRKNLGYTDLSDTLNMFVKHTEIFPEAFKKNLCSKHKVLSEYSNPILSFIFQNINFFHFYSDIIWLLSHVVMIFSLEGRCISRRHTHTLKMFAKATEKVLEVFEKSFSSKHEFYQNIPTSFLPNFNYFRFSWHIIWSVHCVVTILLLTQN